MAEPLVKTKTYYECPFCGAKSYHRNDIVFHMDECGDNPAFPEKHCPSCANAYYYNTTRLAGHDRGKRVPTTFRGFECHAKGRCKGDKRCKYYIERKKEEYEK